MADDPPPDWERIEFSQVVDLKPLVKWPWSHRWLRWLVKGALHPQPTTVTISFYASKRDARIMMPQVELSPCPTSSPASSSSDSR
jgi:hypothetical protein